MSPLQADASHAPAATVAGHWPTSLLAVLAGALLLSLWTALRFPLLDPDEGRNAEVAREMAASGDVIIPHLAGVPYLDKPVALFAAAAAAVRVIGPHRIAPRLPAMIASFAALLLLARMSRKFAGDGQALRATLLTAAAPLYAGLSAYVIFDMPLALCVTVIWLGLARELTVGVSKRRRLCMFAALGLGILLKGPIMLGWAFGGSVATALLLRERAPLRWLSWWPGWLLAIGLAGGWFALALQRHPEYAHYALVEESLERLTTSSFHREQPWWFVPVVLVGGTLLWSVITPWRWPQSRPARVAAGFVLFAAVFFSLSHSKLVTYLLPVIPALAYVAAESWGRAAPRLPRYLCVALCFTPLVLVGGSPWIARYMHQHSGDALAQAIDTSGGGAVRYEDCYSPGTDFLLDRIGTVVSATGSPLTSNYVVRYRELLAGRGLWPFHATPAAAPPAAVIVRAAKNAAEPPPGGRLIFSDARFKAWRLAAAGN